MEKERTSPWLILFRVVFTAALIACMAVISPPSGIVQEKSAPALRKLLSTVS